MLYVRAILTICLILVGGLGANAQTGFKVGDEVKGKVNGQTFNGVVLETIGRLTLKVRFDDGKGNTITKTLSTREVERIEQKKKISSAKERLWIIGKARSKLKATLVGRNRKSIELRKKDGTSQTVNLDDLSVFDKRYVNEFALDIPKSGTKPKSISNALLTPKPINLERAKTKIPAAFVTHWEWEPTKPSTKRTPPDPSRPVTVKPIPDNTFNAKERLFSYMFSDDGKYIATSQILGSGSDSKRYIQISEVRNTYNSRLFKIPKVSAFRLLAGNYLLSTSNTELDIWDAKSFEHLKSWKTNKSFKTVRHVKDSVIATFDKQGLFTVWDFISGEVMIQAKGYPLGMPAFTEDGQLVALPLKDGALLIRCIDGKIVGSLKTTKNINSWAFSPDGLKLAGATFNNIYVWWMKDGMQIADFYQKGSGMNGMVWVNNEHILIDKTYLIDSRYEIEVWRFKGYKIDRLERSANGQLWYMMKALSKNNNSIIPCKIPDRHMLKKLEVLDSGDRKVLQPGMSFRLDFDGLTMVGEKRQEAINEIRKKMKENNFREDKDSEYLIRVFINKGSPESRIYQARPFQNFLTTFTPSHCWIVISKQGDVIWKSKMTAEPGPFVRLNPNESLNDYAKRASIPQPFHFRFIKIPRNLSRLPDDAEYLGSSKLLETGLQHDDR